MDNPDAHRSRDQLALAREVAGDDDAFLRELLQAFVSDASTRLEALLAEAGRSDATGAMARLHSLKGSAMSIGATKMASLAMAAEDAVRKLGLENARVELDAFQREFENLKDTIREEIGS